MIRKNEFLLVLINIIKIIVSCGSVTKTPFFQKKESYFMSRHYGGLSTGFLALERLFLMLCPGKVGKSQEKIIREKQKIYIKIKIIKK